VSAADRLDHALLGARALALTSIAAGLRSVTQPRDQRVDVVGGADIDADRRAVLRDDILA
jgi:hypothetical protein